MRVFITYLLSLIMAFRLVACGMIEDITISDSDEAVADITVTASPVATPEAATVSYQELEYIHYDPTDFYAAIDEMVQLAEADDIDAVIEAYTALHATLETVYTMSTLALIAYYSDVTDGYWSEESVYTETLLIAMEDAIYTGMTQVINSPCGEAFAAYLGATVAEELEDYQALTDREAELIEQEALLITEYYDLMNTEDTLTYSYLGESWDWNRLTGYRGQALAYTDYSGYLEFYYGLMAQMNELVGEVYVQLVQNRAEQAAIEGFDSYTDYIYQEGYGRDYTAEDAQMLCDAVKVIAQEYYNSLYRSNLWTAYTDVTPSLDSDALLNALAEYAGQVDSSLSEIAAYMIENGLYSLGNDDNRISGSFSTYLPLCESPFMFVTLNGNCKDLGTVTHEFGHCCYYYLHTDADILTTVNSLDLMEVHSNGLEVLFTAFYADIFSDGADIAEFITVGKLLQSVISGCIYDEFQREVYANPTMTLDEMNRLFCRICEAYGKTELLNVDYSWIYVAHNFEAPLYYISYATSSLAALQLWTMAQEDFDAAAAVYMSILQADASEGGYLSVLSDCGLAVFTDPTAVQDILTPIIEWLESMS